MPVLHTSGVEINYAVEGDGPPVLLVQGAGVIGEGWRPQLNGLKDRYTLVAFDNRGIGHSRWQGRRLTIEDMADDAFAVMAALGFERFHVAGHSMGGLIAQQMALTSRDRIASLALLCTFAHGAQGSRMTPAMFVTALRTRIGTRAMRRNAFTALVMPAAHLRRIGHAQVAEQLRPLFGRDLAEQPPIVMQQVRAMSRFDAGDRLHTLSGIPTLVVSATHDRIARPEFGRELANTIRGARYVEIPDAGHGVTIQKADAINDLLEQHLASTSIRMGQT